LYVRNAEPGTRSPPAWLQWAGHGLYAYAFLLGLRAAIIFVGPSAPPGGNAFDGFLALPAIGLGFAALLVRRVPRGAAWIATHVLWITVTFCVIAMMMALTGIVLVVAVLFAGPFPPLGRLILAPWISVPLGALWYAWRILHGYLLYLRGRPTSAAIRPAFMTAHPSRRAPRSLNT
jgi:hypothetical protein